MKEIKIGSATVRIHGNADQDRVKEATIKFMKKVERKRRNEKQKNHA